MLQSKFCSSCGSKLEAGDKFCPHCGGSIQGAAVEETSERTSGQSFRRFKLVYLFLLMVVIMIPLAIYVLTSTDLLASDERMPSSLRELDQNEIKKIFIGHELDIYDVNNSFNNLYWEITQSDVENIRILDIKELPDDKLYFMTVDYFGQSKIANITGKYNCTFRVNDNFCELINIERAENTKPEITIDLTGDWVGFYTASQGKTAVILTIIEVDENGRITNSIFDFGPHEGNPTIPSGKFKMSGKLSDSLDLEGVEWIEQPVNYEMVDIRNGYIQLQENTLKGYIYGKSSFGNAGEIEVNYNKKYY
ncbi:zinc ribbon domain-containing protein [Candidatus Contubernalis alkaliaceticus]|uniref:zinc ribbon domain-containing protein n=1 Tax=Candidatus Contubernalis alkaliaceticus TaxID=338645 RepID=UPI001F4C2D3B|nr:zinc ribbon domain-containing protein [Candidatus Contubernalis alkalaceticus]UNC91111.1 zinc-ribbon domain-containing protein [Candidatus Contubernalis alkalaceticus]